MAKVRRLSDDEIMDYTYNKLFGDLDRIESSSMFGDSKEDVSGAAPNAGTPGIEGIDITIKPKMAAAAESERPDDLNQEEPDEGESEEDKLKGIGKISSLMERLHGNR